MSHHDEEPEKHEIYNFPEKNKRRWQCFVCGLEHENYEAFEKHVKNAHEEGREYLECPKCKAPIRDLKQHWKVKHPLYQMPKDIQFRAVVWKDQTSRGLKTKKGHYKTGQHTSPKNGGQAMNYRSGYELRVYKALDELPDVVSYKVEPIHIEYYFKGKTRNYIPDIVVYFVDGHKEVWEVKPSSQTTLSINSQKWKYAEDYCNNRGMFFKVITEKLIDGLEHDVRELKKNDGDNKGFFDQDPYEDD
jgi:hypothetical protein